MFELVFFMTQYSIIFQINEYIELFSYICAVKNAIRCMKMENQNSSEESLLKMFNERDSIAFGAVYDILYREVYCFTSSFYRNSTTDPQDIIQDTFMNIWQNRRLKFDHIKDIKTYIYVVVRNKFRMEYNHLKVVSSVNEKLSKSDDLFIIEAAEAEIFSFLPSVLNMLPVECARTFKLYLEGYETKEIAQILNKTESTIYTQRKDAVAILSKKLSKEKLMIILAMLLIR